MHDVLQFPAAAGFPPAASDAAARALALDTRSSCIVEAPAGSGKTGVLVQRYLKLLADELVDEPEEVLAITFTNKATAELRERVLEQLQAAASDAPFTLHATEFDHETRALAAAALERSNRRGWSLLHRPQRLNIRSIDSVCAEIANSLPLLSGGGGPRQPVEDAQTLYRLAARRTLLQLGGGDAALDAALRTVLLHRDGSLADCEALLANMLQTREQWGELVPLGPDELNEAKLGEVRVKLERSLERIVCAGLSRAVAAMPPGLLAELTTIAARLGEAPPFKLDVSPIAICAGRHEPPEAAAEHLEHWLALITLVLTKEGGWRKRCARGDLKFEIQKPHQTHLEMLITSVQNDPLQEALCAVRALPPPKYPDDQWLVAKALFHVLRRALAELKVLFAERGECDFTELALAARTALRTEDGATDAALSAGGKLRHLLVDEMQDTSSGQYELLELLTRSWDGHSQTLFLVGDPKQSIYLFRQARVERFLRTMREQRLGEISLRALQLTANFRSQAALVDDFNNVFERLFPQAGDEAIADSEALDVPFVAANAVRRKTSDEGITWHTAVIGETELDPDLPRTGNLRGDHIAHEARQVRRVIKERLAMPLPSDRSDPQHPKPWRIAVLGRTRAHLEAIIAELKRDEPISFRAVDLDPLDELPEVLDVLALTRALMHPADRIAWLAVLHAPWCGLGIADLLRLTGEGDEADPAATITEVLGARRNLLSDEGRQLVDRAWPVLEWAIATLGRTSLGVHVERTWRSLGGDAALNAEARTNVVRYLAVLGEVETQSSSVDLSVLTARLKKLYAEPASEALVNGIQPVDLMTIHKAKGLEWDVVLVPALERGSGSSNSVLLNWLEFDGMQDEADATVVLAPIWRTGAAADNLSSWLSGVRAKREHAERKRLLYVASTRAREQLHLFATVARKADGEIAQPRYDSLLRACWPAAMNELDAMEAEPAEYEDLAIAAAAEPATDARRSSHPSPPTIQRLPLSFDPSARFNAAANRRLAYPPASALRRTPSFDRPEGSFAVRAFGNVVHRYLQVIAARLESGLSAEELLVEFPTWTARLTASLRGEGLPPTLATREAARALRALTLTLTDPVGRWILSPRASAASERALTMADARSLRVDRTFVSGDAPLSNAKPSIWIIDFKTTEQGARSDADFEAAETAKYRDQLEAYATLRGSLPDGDLPIRLGLYYPLVPKLLQWESVATAVVSG
jgi:ATP-dependent exoDNAse (exonuclease V) beta subunit